MDKNLSRIITAMISTERSRRNDLVRAAFHAGGPLPPIGHSRRHLGAEQIAADEYEARADAWLTIVRRTFSDTAVAWTVETAADVTTLLTAELATDWDVLLRACYSWAGRDVPSSSPTFEFVRKRAADHVRQEIELSVLAQDRTRIPVAEQLRAPRYAVVHDGWTKAHDLLQQSPPDSSNAAKEAVGAVEQLARIVTASPEDTLGDCIKTLRATDRVQPPLLKGIEELWGWTSGEPGVRHGTGAITPVEAQYVLTIAEAALLLLLSVDVA